MTRRHRARHTATPAEFSFGPERDAYEERLPATVQDVVAVELLGYPGSYRHFLKDQVYEILEATGSRDLEPVALRRRVRAMLKSILVDAGAEISNLDETRT
jgi:hypothetical protein